MKGVNVLRWTIALVFVVGMAVVYTKLFVVPWSWAASGITGLSVGLFMRRLS